LLRQISDDGVRGGRNCVGGRRVGHEAKNCLRIKRGGLGTILGEKEARSNAFDDERWKK